MPRAYNEYDVSDKLKEHGWVLPAYTMAPNAKHVMLLRAVIRCVGAGGGGRIVGQGARGQPP